jgi:hypothetical protein
VDQHLHRRHAPFLVYTRKARALVNPGLLATSPAQRQDLVPGELRSLEIGHFAAPRLWHSKAIFARKGELKPTLHRLRTYPLGLMTMQPLTISAGSAMSPCMTTS